MPDPTFPETIDVFLPLLDGYHPISPVDHNEAIGSLEALEDTLGFGISPTYGGTPFGPKGANADVAERLNTFLTDEGGLHDVAFVTGTIFAGAFTENDGGAFIPFGQTISGLDYRILFMVSSQDTSGTSSTGTDIPHPHIPSFVWVSIKRLDGVFLKARTVDGWTFNHVVSEKVIFQLLVFGPASTE